jgi:hypothetical protein
MAKVAQDTFVAELDTGPVLVQKGAILGNGHPAVKLHGKSALFADVDLGEDDEAPAKRPRGRPRKNPLPADGNGDNGDENGEGE